MARAAAFAAFAITATGLGLLANWTEGLGVNPGNAITWGLGLFTGLLLGSLAEQRWRGWPFRHRASKP